MHPMDSTYGRAEAEQEGWRRGFAHAIGVVESAQFDSSHPNGGRALEAFKQTLLMALRVAEKVARPGAESVVGALPDQAGTREHPEVRDA